MDARFPKTIYVGYQPEDGGLLITHQDWNDLDIGAISAVYERRALVKPTVVLEPWSTRARRKGSKKRKKGKA